ncbi:hypothetical protein T11_12260 [Trichinella zimbabwensis]|uniref:Uncharacterized protein n=1 Tax=Trichinella zimbabwensis TaxID=268475 RepID=A0A0V1HQ15_9BILA|nr:hypothetical protein T11_12260 [Trichinella zimbabwensis]
MEQHSRAASWSRPCGILKSSTVSVLQRIRKRTDSGREHEPHYYGSPGSIYKHSGTPFQFLRILQLKDAEILKYSSIHVEISA